MKRAAFAASLLLLTGAAPVTPPEPREKDEILSALDDELSRARALAMQKLERPHHLQAYVTEEDGFQVSASFGALVSQEGGLRSILQADVRVGTPALDDTMFVGGSGGRFGPIGGTPSEADYDALRQALWLRLDAAYKRGLESLSAKRAYLEQNQVKERPPDFSPAPVVSLVLPRVPLTVNRDRWTAAVRRASAVFRDYPEVDTSSVSLRASVQHLSYVSSEKVKVRFTDPFARLSISASGQAPDGMDVRAVRDWFVRTEDELPKDEELQAAAVEVAKRLTALANAQPLAEDYQGPVLFGPKAAAVFFLRTVGDPLSHPREPLGLPHPGRLTERLGKHVASKVVTAKDDPTLQKWRGQSLLGYFPVDDDAVKPEPITLIDQGVLKTYYMSRVPTLRVAKTNGHSRAGEGSVGSLFIETSAPQPQAALKKQLLELMKEEDLEYGIYVEELEDSAAFRSGSPTLSLPAPLVAYRVYADGREELLRGATFKPAPFRALKEIAALGDTQVLLNTHQGSQRVSIVAPAVLVKNLELQKPREEFEKPPVIPRPKLARQ